VLPSVNFRDRDPGLSREKKKMNEPLKMAVRFRNENKIDRDLSKKLQKALIDQLCCSVRRQQQL
jgi:hypothetical protein